DPFVVERQGPLTTEQLRLEEAEELRRFRSLQRGAAIDSANTGAERVRKDPEEVETLRGEVAQLQRLMQQMTASMEVLVSRTNGPNNAERVAPAQRGEYTAQCERGNVATVLTTMTYAVGAQMVARWIDALLKNRVHRFPFPAETVDAMGDVGGCHLVIQMRTSEIRGAIQAFVATEGRFDRRNVTEYLRRFEVAMKPLRLADADIAPQFELTVHEDFDEQVRELTMGMTWVRAKERLREAFRQFDETRVTVERLHGRCGENHRQWSSGSGTVAVATSTLEIPSSSTTTAGYAPVGRSFIGGCILRLGCDVGFGGAIFLFVRSIRPFEL
ncbi:MAG: hypothetical protein BJ554DRAFT_5274, partial [Olpidium bornovanus]